MIAGLGVISESYFLQHPGSAEAKSAKYCFFFSGFSMAEPCLFLLFPWSWRGPLHGIIFIPKARSLNMKKKERKKTHRHFAFPEVTTYLLIEDFEARGFHWVLNMQVYLNSL